MERVPEDVRTKAESTELKQKLGDVDIPAGTESWMRYVTSSGEVFTQPRVIKRLSEEEKEEREEKKEEAKRERAERKKERAEEKAKEAKEKLERAKVKAEERAKRLAKESEEAAKKARDLRRA